MGDGVFVVVVVVFLSVLTLWVHTMRSARYKHEGENE